MNYTEHYSVLKKEVLENFKNIIEENRDYYFADLTFGGGGHSFAMLDLGEDVYVRSVDQDPDALKNGNERIEKSPKGDRIKLFDSNFVNFPKIYEEHIKEESQGLDGILMDLGVSCHHFDSFERGFSFREDAYLDMRMNNRGDGFKSAADVLNTYSSEELLKIFYEYGEEKFSKKIVENIEKYKKEKGDITRTSELENIVFHSYPKKLRHGRINPATKIFQALRIEVNKELEVVAEVIPQLIPLLKVGGILQVISFHSLEDRIVKHTFKKFEKGEIPLKVLTKKPIVPSDEEILENSRSRSAKLRVIKRLEKKESKNKYKRD